MVIVVIEKRGRGNEGREGCGCSSHREEGRGERGERGVWL